MSKLSQWLNTFWLRNTLAVTALVVTLLAILNLLVFNYGTEAFIDVFEAAPIVQVDQFGNPVGLIVPAENVKEEYRIRQIDPLRKAFRDRFQVSLVQVTFLGIVGSIAVGFLTSQIIVNQLKRLQHAMQTLRGNNYRVQLEDTGVSELDNLINEFNQLVVELQTTEELRKNLISDTSHELKTPITALRGQLEGVRDKVLKLNTERWKILLEQVDRLQSLVDGLQTYTQLRSNAIKPKFKQLELAAFAKEIVANWHKPADKDFQYILDVPAELTVKADGNLLQHIFNNLLENTARYAQATTITIKASPEQIVFQDNGIGVPEKSLKYLFERFYRVEQSRNRATGGMGLGLAIVKEMIEAMGWSVNVENDKGLKFTISL